MKENGNEGRPLKSNRRDRGRRYFGRIHSPPSPRQACLGRAPPFACQFKQPIARPPSPREPGASGPPLIMFAAPPPGHPVFPPPPKTSLAIAEIVPLHQYQKQTVQGALFRTPTPDNIPSISVVQRGDGEWTWPSGIFTKPGTPSTPATWSGFPRFKNSGGGRNAIIRFSGGSKEPCLSQTEGGRIKVEIDGIRSHLQKRRSGNGSPLPRKSGSVREA